MAGRTRIRRRRPRRRHEQQGLPFDRGKHGGKRDRAGRPRSLPGRPCVPHLRRPLLKGTRFPVHVTTRLRLGLPRLRRFYAAQVLRKAFAAGCNKPAFRICHYSIQGNHIHLVCEADDAKALARGVQGWAIRVARGLNRRWKRAGSVFGDRYHAEILTTPTQVKNALVYVLQNARRHGELLPAGLPDLLYTSSWYFDGWRDARWRRRCVPPDEGDPPVAQARTWLLATGWWEKCGRVGTGDMPAGAAVR